MTIIRRIVSRFLGFGCLGWQLVKCDHMHGKLHSMLGCFKG